MCTWDAKYLLGKGHAKWIPPGVEENGVCEDYFVSGVNIVVISFYLHRAVVLLPQMQNSFWEVVREHVSVNLEVRTHRQREDKIQQFKWKYLLYLSRRTPKQCPGWEANVTHGVSRRNVRIQLIVLSELFPSYPTCKVETGHVPPETLGLQGVPGKRMSRIYCPVQNFSVFPYVELCPWQLLASVSLSELPCGTCGCALSITSLPHWFCTDPEAQPPWEGFSCLLTMFSGEEGRECGGEQQEKMVSISLLLCLSTPSNKNM